jgi:hypothetical protein
MTRVGYGLGRRIPPDDRHIRRYSLTADTIPTTPTPVVLGVNWYSGFEYPTQAKDRSWWLPRAGQSLGYVRGGHAICVRPDALRDVWKVFYDQGNEGSCVGYAISRMMSLLNRERYDGHALYHAAQAVDDWDDTPPESGTSVRAGCDVARKQGLWRVIRGKTAAQPTPDRGIAENRWARSVEDIAACLSPSDGGSATLNRGWVRLVNSWGLSYPEVRLDLEVLHRLVFMENGEATVVTDVPNV